MESQNRARFNLNRKYGQETAVLYERTYAHYLSFIEWRHNMVRWHSPAAKSAFPVFTVSWTRTMRRHNAPFHAAFWHLPRHVLASSTSFHAAFWHLPRHVLASSPTRWPARTRALADGIVTLRFHFPLRLFFQPPSSPSPIVSLCPDRVGRLSFCP